MMKRISSVIKIAELVILLLISLIIVGYLWTALIYMLLFNLILFDYFFMKKRIYSCSISTIQKIINFLHIKFGLETIDRDEAKLFFIWIMIIAVLYSVNFIGNISKFSSCISQFEFSHMDSCYKKNDWVWERYDDSNL